MGQAKGATAPHSMGFDLPKAQTPGLPGEPEVELCGGLARLHDIIGREQTHICELDVAVVSTCGRDPGRDKLDHALPVCCAGFGGWPASVAVGGGEIAGHSCISHGCPCGGVLDGYSVCARVLYGAAAGTHQQPEEAHSQDSDIVASRGLSSSGLRDLGTPDIGALNMSALKLLCRSMCCLPCFHSWTWTRSDG